MTRTEKPSRPSSSRPSRLGLASLLLLPALVATGGGQTPPPQPEQIIITGQVARLAIPECVAKRSDEATAKACKTITEVLRNDLRFEGLFQFVPESLFSAIATLSFDAPKFEDWAGIGTTILVTLRADVTPDPKTKKDQITLEAKVYSASSGQTMLARQYSGPADNPRVFAHQASDDIMTLTQYKGVARSKIAFVSDRTATKERRSKEIFIVDYDGHNVRQVTVNGSLNILPAWSPDGRQLAYTSYRQPPPGVFISSPYEMKNYRLSGTGSQAFAPAWSPDGKRVAYAANTGGNMEIFVSGADGSGARKVTTTSASETAPCWSPTGNEIAFTSDRGGTPQIYVMDAEGLNVRRLTTVGNWNDAPTWNPSKQYSEIAYTARLEGGGFDIAIIDLATRQIRQITQGRGSCEYPSWAPSGRHLAFSCNRGGRWQLAVSDREGRTFQFLSATGAGNNVQPDWGS
jgi:TolB protein